MVAMLRRHVRQRWMMGRTSMVFVALLSLAAACESAESKQMKALAGTWVWEYETDPVTDPGHMWLHEKRELTLRPDGSWSSTQLAEIGGNKESSSSDSGHYRVNGVTLVTRATENYPAQSFTVSGDTLWIRAAAAIAETKAVTGVDFAKSDTPDYYVRKR
jgi:hypothetical protein